MNSRIFTGWVAHTRQQPCLHRFRYPLFFAGVELDELPELSRTVAGFAYNRFAPLALHDRDFMRPDGRCLRDKAWEHLPDARAGDRILLVTSFRYFGRLFSPVSFYLHTRDGVLQAVLAEVNNTFHDRHLYRILDLKGDGDVLTGTHEKTFHVSPFNNMAGEYRFRFAREPFKTLDISVDLWREGREVFTSRMWGEPRPFSSATVRRVLLRHPFAAALTMPRILVQAAHLYFRRRLPVFKRPAPTHPDTLLHRGVPAP